MENANRSVHVIGLDLIGHLDFLLSCGRRYGNYVYVPVVSQAADSADGRPTRSLLIRYFVVREPQHHRSQPPDPRDDGETESGQTTLYK